MTIRVGVIAAALAGILIAFMRFFLVG